MEALWADARGLLSQAWGRKLLPSAKAEQATAFVLPGHLYAWTFSELWEAAWFAESDLLPVPKCCSSAWAAFGPVFLLLLLLPGSGGEPHLGGSCGWAGTVRRDGIQAANVPASPGEAPAPAGHLPPKRGFYGRAQPEGLGAEVGRLHQPPSRAEGGWAGGGLWRAGLILCRVHPHSSVLLPGAAPPKPKYGH